LKVVDPYVAVPGINGVQLLRNIEEAGRVCYKSEDAITGESYYPFIEKILKLGHESIFEHEKVTARIVCDRGVSHEIVRHRLAAYSMESSRYCNYSKGKFGGEITVIRPFFFPEGSKEYMVWYSSCKDAEDSYMRLLRLGRTPQEARSVLPNSLKTEIVVTYDLREWRHFFRLRCAKEAHPQMQQIAIPLLLYFKEQLKPLFDDIGYNKDFNSDNYARIFFV